jgi:type IV secretory pathway TraG/TraD family ATPase VirD4
MKAKTRKPPRPALLENVRTMLCEPETRDPDAPELTDEELKLGGRVKSGLRFHAAQMIASGHWQIADLAGRYIKEGSREIDSIISTGRTQTEWLLSEPMRSDLRKNGVNWSQLAEKPTTVFLIVPAEFLETQEGSVWLRLCIMSALRALYGRAGRRKVKDIVLMLSEFAALGKLKAVESARSQGRKYGIRLWPVIQDIHQLRDIYGPHGAESFAGQCQAVFAFAPGEFESAEWMSRRSGEEDFVSLNASESDDRPGVHRSYTIQRQRAWPPERILDLPEFHGLVWFHRRSKPVPVYTAPYWTIPACKRLARPDPYHDDDDGMTAPLLPQSGPLPASTPLLSPPPMLNRNKRPLRLAGRVAGLVALPIVAGVWLWNATGAADPSSLRGGRAVESGPVQQHPKPKPQKPELTGHARPHATR